MDYNIKQATTMAEKIRVYEFRYKIYNDELKKDHIHFDHNLKLCFDDLDHDAIVFYAEYQGEIVGTIRSNFAFDKPFHPRLKYTFQLKALIDQIGQDKISICSMFMVAPEFRKTMVCGLLVTAIYTYGLDHGILINHCVCEEGLVKLYKRLGFREFLSSAQKESQHKRHIMTLCLRDYQHLISVLSPFALQLNETLDDQGLTSKLLQTLYSTKNEAQGDTYDYATV